MNLWPFRKSTTIYKWDDNWRPICKNASITSLSPIVLEYTIPSEFYAAIIWIHAQTTNNPALASHTTNLEIFRGTDRILFCRFNTGTQQVGIVDYFFFHACGFLDYSRTLNFLPRQPIPLDFPVIPGDIIRLTSSSASTTPEESNAQIYLKAYYF